MLETVFLRLVNTSLAAGWLILAIILLRFIFWKAPRWIFCLLWGLAGVRLIFPFSIESPLSLVPSAQPIPSEMLYSAAPHIDSGVAAIDRVVNPMLSASLSPAVGASVNPTQVLSFVLAWIWLFGAAAILIYLLISAGMLFRRVRTATRLENGVKESDKIDAPFVFGIFRPVIYLPYHLENEVSACVIAHEKAHIRRGDHLWKLLGALLLAVYWFNPLMLLSYVLLCRDIETACDEKVVRHTDSDFRRAYAAALLHCSTHRRFAAAFPPASAFGEVGVKARVKRVLDLKKPSGLLIAAAVVAALCAVVFFLTNPVRSAKTFQLTFPGDDAERTEFNREVFDISPFEITFSLPDGWRVGKTGDTDSGFLMIGAFSRTPIYDGDGKTVGAVGFNRYELYEGAEDEPMAIYNQVALGNDWQFAVRNTYTVVEKNDDVETAVVDVLYSPILFDENAPEHRDGKTNRGILSYHRGKTVYVAFEFDSTCISEEQLSAVAKSVRFSD